MISFENVSKFILSDVTTYIQEGKIVGVIGVSGAGKTTMLKLAAGLLLPDKGCVHTLGVNPVKCRKEIAKDVRAYFAQIPFFDGQSRVLDEFDMIRDSYGIDKETFQKQYRMLEEQLDFGKLREKKVSTLSVGQRRRAELAALLLGDAKLIILDEPVNGLDEQAKNVFLKQLEKRKKENVTVLISSHNMREMANLCDRIMLLEEGKLIYYGNKDRLIRLYAPVNKMEIRFEGDIPDMEDLPIVKYSIENNLLRLQYNSNVISAAEITRHIIGQTKILQMKMSEPELADVMFKRKEEVSNESFH